MDYMELLLTIYVITTFMRYVFVTVVDILYFNKRTIIEELKDQISEINRHHRAEKETLRGNVASERRRADFLETKLLALDKEASEN